MTKKQSNKLKTDILSIVHHSGIGIRAEPIQDQLALPDAASLNTLLTELVTDGLLTRRATLLNNGEVDYLYNLSSTL